MKRIIPSPLPTLPSSDEETDDESSETSRSEDIVAATPPPTTKRKYSSVQANEPPKSSSTQTLPVSGMTKKMYTPLRPSPPSESKSDEEESDGESDEETSRSEDIVSTTPPPNKKQKNFSVQENESPKAKSPSTQTLPGSEMEKRTEIPQPPLLPSESKSEGETDDESEETSSSGHMVATTPSPLKKILRSNGKENEPSKPEPSSTVSGSKRPFRRLWTYEDELVLVNGLVEYQEKYGKSPVSAGDFSVLANELKGKFQFDYSISQLMNKNKGFKKKVKKNLVNGYTSSANKDNQKCLDILKNIWRDELEAKFITSSKKQKQRQKKNIVAILDEVEVAENEERDIDEDKDKDEDEDEDKDEDEDEDVYILEDIIDKHAEGPFKRKMMKRLMSIDPKTKQHWIDIFMENMNLRGTYEINFMKSLLNKD
ncbi:hypothetical protein ZOSMA_185G00260 [Zostera marina]|uniref:Glabrous enhancer-binding protein-like DBD domain-containing protein n=1 Tax=Zostera marina TaxID=29655 RepID=A0A0K9PSL7_ZOSMR|nr:hypothetical protein ZOSMA_185G00260 [Zostera marina]